MKSRELTDSSVSTADYCYPLGVGEILEAQASIREIAGVDGQLGIYC